MSQFRGSRKFAHSMTLDYYKGNKLRVVCSCGKQSPVFRDDEEFAFGPVLSKEQRGRDWFDNHHGIREIRPKARQPDG